MAENTDDRHMHPSGPAWHNGPAWPHLHGTEKRAAYSAMQDRESSIVLHDFLDGFARGVLYERGQRVDRVEELPLLAEAPALPLDAVALTDYLEADAEGPRYTLRQAQEIQEQIVREVADLLGVAQGDVLEDSPHLLADDGEGAPIRSNAFLRSVPPGWTDSVSTHLARAFARALVFRLVADGPVRLQWVDEHDGDGVPTPERTAEAFALLRAADAIKASTPGGAVEIAGVKIVAVDTHGRDLSAPTPEP